MTPEDETFLKLRQLPFDELNLKVKNLTVAELQTLSLNEDLRVKWLNSHGWSEPEFVAAVKTRLGINSSE